MTSTSLQLPKYPDPSQAQYVKQRPDGNVDYSRYFAAQYSWGTQFTNAVQQALQPTPYGVPITRIDVQPVDTISLSMTLQDTVQLLCYLVTVLQDAGILAVKTEKST